MTALDVRAIVADVGPLLHRLRVANVYDISSKVYVLKLSEGDTKRFLVCEAGVRFHLSDWKRQKQSETPSVFTMRLRKFLRTKRVTGCRQLGSDRVIDIKFGHNENSVHLIIELYSRGNVILTDHEFIVKASWRQLKGDEAHAVKINHLYPLDHYLNTTITCSEYNIDLKTGTINADILAKMAPSAHRGFIEYLAKFRYPDLQKKYLDEGCPDCVTKALNEIETIFASFRIENDSEKSPTTDGAHGYGLFKLSCDGEYIMDDFAPFNFHQGVEITNTDPENGSAPTSRSLVRRYDSFSQCVDRYFSNLEVSKAEKNQGEKVNELESRVTRIQHDQESRLRNLEIERDLAEREALSVENNCDFVDSALSMMRQAHGTGTDWDLIEKMLKLQKSLDHPIARYISSLDMKNGTFKLLLPIDPAGLQDEGDGGEDQLIQINLDFKLSALANVQNLHLKKKNAQAKYEKTVDAAKRVVTTAQKVLAKEKTKAVPENRPLMKRLRKVFWFEKFYWFISSDAYLVIGGHDGTQNDILYRKYLKKHDIYVHADIHGGSSCIIMQRNPQIPIPESTINQAGMMAVCRSNAWTQKILTQAYWVHAHQVSKTPQAGEYITSGGFIIRGKKNPIVINQLEMAIAILFVTPNQDIQGTTSSSKNKNDQSSAEGSDAVLPEDSFAVSPTYERARSEGYHDKSTLKRGLSAVSIRAVQFGSIEVLPTPQIFPHVDFDELPPRIHKVHSNRSIISDDDGHLGEGNSSSDEEPSLSCRRRSSQSSAELKRQDSVDELPPPPLYLGRGSAKDLLTHRILEVFEDPPVVHKNGNLCKPVDTEQTAQDRIRRRSNVVDGGPMPTGFLENELPPAKVLLSLGSKSNEDIPVSKNLLTIISQKEMSRAKRQKLKKIKEKYGELSDYEQEIAMKFLGTKPIKELMPQEDKEAKSTELHRILQEHKATEINRPDRNVKIQFLVRNYTSDC